jgi:citrate lyase subunit beta / citryl-CoA lyase
MRIRRSQLAVPGSSPKMIRQAAGSAADHVFLDLEDSVAASRKEESRRNVVEGLKTLDWGGKTVCVRINGLDTALAYRDIIEIVESAGERLDTVMVPKVRCPEDIYFVDTLLSQIEQRMGLKKRIGIEALIETAEGLVNVEKVAFSSRRLESLIFGPADFAASVGVPGLNIGAQPISYPGHLWHFPMFRIVTAAKAAGLQAIDGPFGAYQDLEGLRTAAEMARALGYDGKWAVHPAQIEVVHQVFTPSEEQVRHARAFAAHYSSLAAGDGTGAMAMDGQMVDEASLKMAQDLLRRAEMAEGARTAVLVS